MVRQKTWQELQNARLVVVVGLQMWESRDYSEYAGAGLKGIQPNLNAEHKKGLQIGHILPRGRGFNFPALPECSNLLGTQLVDPDVA